MINTDEDALICDLAETYHIYNYRSLPCKLVATFSCGLRDDSRIKTIISGVNATIEEILLASIADSSRLLAWMQTEDGVNGVNKPGSVLSIILQMEEDSEIDGFESGKEFDEEWRKLTGKVKNDGN